MWDDEVRFGAAWVLAQGSRRQGPAVAGAFPPSRAHQRTTPRGARFPAILEEPHRFTTRMKHERRVDGAVARAWSCAEIMPAQNAGVRPVGSRQEVVVLADDGTVAVADVQFRHGAAHPLLHHFLIGQNRGQSLPDALRQ